MKKITSLILALVLSSAGMMMVAPLARSFRSVTPLP